MSILDCFLICVVGYCVLRACVEIYYVIHLRGFERGLEAVEPIIDQAVRAAYRQGRIDQLNIDQQAIYEVSEKSFNAGRSSVMFSCLDRVN